jgi:hypothetical protein
VLNRKLTGDDLKVSLDRDTFLGNFMRELAGTLEEVAVSNLTREQLADVLVDPPEAYSGRLSSD